MLPHSGVLNRACDRCYKIRARCVFSNNTAVCNRCARLDYPCITERAFLQPGRPRKASRLATASAIQQPTGATVNNQAISGPEISRSLPFRLDSDTEFTTFEASLVEFTFHSDQLSKLVHGRNFVDLARFTLATRLFFAAGQLKDGFLAFATALWNHRHGSEHGAEVVAHVPKGAKALQILRTPWAPTVENARTALVLALALVTYNDLAIGAPTLPITRSALLMVEPWQADLVGMTTEDTDPNLIGIMFAEAFECLVLGQVPVFCFQLFIGNTIVDRYYGVCHELLPHFYHLCLLYRAIRSDSISNADVAAQTKALTHEVSGWEPEAAVSLRSSVIDDPAAEKHFLRQARTFQLTLLLLLLETRRSPANDLIAGLKLGQLEAEIEQAVLESAGRPKYLLFPYFVSCLRHYENHTTVPASVMNTMLDISNNMAPKSCQSMFACLQHIVRNKQRRPGMPWFKCIDTTMDWAIGP